MSQPPETPTSEAHPEKPQHEAPSERGPGRLARFGREHPALTVAGLAGAGLLGGLEMAAGVLLGAGVAALLRRPDGEAMTEAPAQPRGRVRRMLEHAPHDLQDLKARARAVFLAARGDVTVTPRGRREEPAPSPEAGEGHATLA